jgi:flagellin
MSVVINTNYAATAAANNLAASNQNLQKSLNRLSSGSKIVSPSDDAGGLAVSMTLSAEATRMGASATNMANEVSFFQTQDGALQVVGKILDRMSELSTLYTDKTKQTSDKGNYNTEFKALQTELTAISKEAFNGIVLFGDLTTTNLGVAKSTAFTSVASISNLDSITKAITATAALRADNGSAQSVRGFESELNTVNKANLEAANSRIVDVDVAQESTQLARWNILVQSGTSMLAQANSSASIALKLLQ